METRVTALVVAHRDADHLRRTLDALAAQTRRPDRVIAIAADARKSVLQAFEEHAPTQIVTAREFVTFGRAVAEGVRVLDDVRGENDFLWLLAQDSAPEPEALSELLAVFETSPSAAVVGPKLVDWNDRTRLRGFGETMTTRGTTVPLVEDELDQGQHDGSSDVLAVSAPGMLVRRSTWTELDGFDPALGPVDDALDFCVRARLAGRRVVVAASARVATAGDGIAGPPRSRRWAAKQRRARFSRTAQLHRRLVYARGWLVPLLWLTIVPLALVRSVALLVRKQPELIGSEFRSVFRVVFGGTHVLAARRRLAAARTVGWAAIAPLRMSERDLRRRRQLDRDEASAAGALAERPDLRFLSGGGAWTVLASAVVGFIVFIRLVPATTIAGGGLLPLSSDVATLWSNVGYGWRDIGTGFVGAADPFAAVLAVLGTITFWNPSYVLVLLWVLALPLATLTAWFAATRLTERSGYRILAAVLWTIAPSFLSALVDGRPAAVIVHVLLPLLFLTGSVAARSWASAGTTSILLAAIGACAPSLIPALLVIWALTTVLAGPRFARVIFVPVPLAALFAPLVWQQGIVGGHWFALAADPGRAQSAPAVGVLDLLTGFPSAGVGGWASFAERIKLPADVVTAVVPFLLVPLLLCALAALLLRGSSRAVVLWAVALLGAATAVASTLIVVTFVGTEVTSIWPGPGLSLMWLGVVGAAVVGCDTLRARAAIPAVVVGLATAVVVVPLVVAAPLGQSAVASSEGRTLPAYVAAAASTDEGIGTIRITPQADGSIVAAVVRGAGDTLDSESTLVNTGSALTDEDGTLATLAGNLVSVSGADLMPTLEADGIGYVLVAPVDETDETAAATRARAVTALDANPALESVGETDAGTLWRTTEAVKGTERQQHTSVLAAIATVAMIVVFVIALLIALPTSASREAARHRPRTVGRRADPDEAAPSRADLDDEPAPSDDEEPDEDAAGDAGSEAGTDDAATDEPPLDVPNGVEDAGSDAESTATAESAGVRADGRGAQPEPDPLREDGDDDDEEDPDGR